MHHKPIHSAVRKLLSQYSAFSDNSATGVQRCQLSKDSRGGGGEQEKVKGETGRNSRQVLKDKDRDEERQRLPLPFWF